MATRVDVTFHFDIADQEPGMPQTVESLDEWLIPDLKNAVRRVIGYPGDSGVVYANAYSHPSNTDIEVVIIDEEGEEVSTA
jgi:hypothetical protein